MPCRDGGPSDGEVIRDYAKRNDLLARLLCEACEKIDKHTSFGVKTCSKELQEWWRKHQEFDRKRREDEDKAATKAQKLRKALSKLTKEEIALLKELG